LLAEQNATTGAVTREYVWIDDVPVALMDISGSTVTTDFIHTGQIGEPLAVTSSTQALVWNAYIDPYGNAEPIGMPATTLDMRLPGQSFQLETNSLSQNGYRDYDPGLGRYIEADPLGIIAGQNVYAYVFGDPLNLTDPLGLCPSDTNLIPCIAKNSDAGGIVGGVLGGLAAFSLGYPILPYSLFGSALSGGGPSRGTSVISALARGFIGPGLDFSASGSFVNSNSGQLWNTLSDLASGEASKAAIVGRLASRASLIASAGLEAYGVYKVYLAYQMCMVQAEAQH
jgi:RHS repeat-associated protein